MNAQVASFRPETQDRFSVFYSQTIELMLDETGLELPDKSLIDATLFKVKKGNKETKLIELRSLFRDKLNGFPREIMVDVLCDTMEDVANRIASIGVIKCRTKERFLAEFKSLILDYRRAYYWFRLVKMVSDRIESLPRN